MAHTQTCPAAGSACFFQIHQEPTGQRCQSKDLAHAIVTIRTNAAFKQCHALPRKVDESSPEQMCKDVLYQAQCHCATVTQSVSLTDSLPPF